MLVVTRRPGQSVLIGRDVEVVILEIEGTQVRVGINAPRSIRVLRRELVTQVGSENRRALEVSGKAPSEEIFQLARYFGEVEPEAGRKT